jgi:hypothetical protein
MSVIVAAKGGKRKRERKGDEIFHKGGEIKSEKLENFEKRKLPRS